MRPTLHEYNLQKLSDLDCTAISDVLNFTKLTNRAPMLGDFVPCGSDGSPMYEPTNTIDPDNPPEIVNAHKKRLENWNQAQSRVIFKGDWNFEEADLLNQFNGYLYYEGEICLFVCYDEEIDQLLFENEDEELVSRIEDLPRQIEFKEGVI